MKRYEASANFNISVSGRFAQVEMFDITPGELWQEAGDIIEEKHRKTFQRQKKNS